MLSGLELMSCQNLAVPAEVMQHVVNVESSRNPYAIGVVGRRLVRQPQNLGEAVATVRMLEQNGYNYSLGVAQVNRTNLGKYGLDSYEKAFDYCPNLTAGSQILAQCYASAGNDWGKAFSCYYSGNFTTGYQDGYVQRVFDSMAKNSPGKPAQAIPIATTAPLEIVRGDKGIGGLSVGSPAYRVAMRSVVDATAEATIGPAATEAAEASPQGHGHSAGVATVINPVQLQKFQSPFGQIPADQVVAAAMSQVGPNIQSPSSSAPARIRAAPATAAVMSQVGVSANLTGSGAAESAPEISLGHDADIYVPQVRGPNEVANTQTIPQTSAAPRQDSADLRNGGRDGAFVF